MANLKRLAVPLAFVALAGCSSVDGIELAEDEVVETTPSEASDDDAATRDDDVEVDAETSDLAFVEGSIGAEAVDSSIVAATDASPLHDVEVTLVGAADVSPPADAVPADVAEFLVVSAGDGDVAVTADGVAGVSYTMVDWVDGSVVERSSDFASPLMVVVGNPADRPPSSVRLPRAVERSLVGLPVGTRLLVSLPAGLTDLPAYLDEDVSHILVVDIESFHAPAGVAS